MSQPTLETQRDQSDLKRCHAQRGDLAADEEPGRCSCPWRIFFWMFWYLWPRKFLSGVKGLQGENNFLGASRVGNCRSFAVEDARHGFWGKKREGSALSKNSARVDEQMIDKRCTERETCRGLYRHVVSHSWSCGLRQGDQVTPKQKP